MNYKQFLVILLFCAMIASLGACGSKNQKSEETSEHRSEHAETKDEISEDMVNETVSVIEEKDFSIKDLDDNTCEVTYCGSEVKKIIVPETLYGRTVVGIGSYAFNQCPAEEIILPNTVQFLEANAFCLCENLKRIDLGTGLQRVGQLAFLSCGKLERVDFPEGMVAIESFAFGGCESLGEVYIPASVTEIPMGIASLSQCPNLVVVTPSGSVAEQVANETGLPVNNP